MKGPGVSNARKGPRMNIRKTAMAGLLVVALLAACGGGDGPTGDVDPGTGGVETTGGGTETTSGGVYN